MPLIPAMRVAEAEESLEPGRRWLDYLRSGVQDQFDQHGETPSLLKKQNTKNCASSLQISDRFRVSELFKKKLRRVVENERV